MLTVATPVLAVAIMPVLTGGLPPAAGVVVSGTTDGKVTAVAVAEPGTVDGDATPSSLPMAASWNCRKVFCGFSVVASFPPWWHP